MIVAAQRPEVFGAGRDLCNLFLRWRAGAAHLSKLSQSGLKEHGRAESELEGAALAAGIMKTNVGANQCGDR